MDPARNGFFWAGYQTETFDPDDINFEGIAHILVALHFMQWTPDPHDVLPGRCSVVLKDMDTDEIIDSFVSEVIDPSATKPVIECVSPQVVCKAGGDMLTIRGRNFLPGATVNFDRVAASSVNVISDKLIVAVTPAFQDSGEKVVVVKQSSANGNRSSADVWQAVKVC